MGVTQSCHSLDNSEIRLNLSVCYGIQCALFLFGTAFALYFSAVLTKRFLTSLKLMCQGFITDPRTIGQRAPKTRNGGSLSNFTRLKAYTAWLEQSVKLTDKNSTKKNIKNHNVMRLFSRSVRNVCEGSAFSGSFVMRICGHMGKNS